MFLFCDPCVACSHWNGCNSISWNHSGSKTIWRSCSLTVWRSLSWTTTSPPVARPSTQLLVPDGLSGRFRDIPIARCLCVWFNGAACGTPIPSRNTQPHREISAQIPNSSRSQEIGLKYIHLKYTHPLMTHLTLRNLSSAFLSFSFFFYFSTPFIPPGGNQVPSGCSKRVVGWKLAVEGRLPKERPWFKNVIDVSVTLNNVLITF